MLKLEINDAPSGADIATIRAGLSAYNVEKVPELVDLPRGNFIVYLREHDDIVAGVVCEFDWGYLYFDAVWTDESVRGKGYGTLVMNAAENYALQQGIHQAYLMTTSFQARPFYEKLGYERFGFQEDRPPGYVFHYMVKSQLSEQVVDPHIVIENPPKKEHLKIIDNGLLNDIAKTAPLSNHPTAILLRDNYDVIHGGLVAGVFWNWMDIRFLWVDDAVKGQGWGKKILTTAEEIAKERDCVGMVCDTASFQALPFYQSQGFEIIGTLKNRPPGHESYFIQKRF